MEKPQLPPDKFRELVNELKTVSVTYAGTQQLRAHISKVLGYYVEPAHINGKKNES